MTNTTKPENVIGNLAFGDECDRIAEQVTALRRVALRRLEWLKGHENARRFADPSAPATTPEIDRDFREVLGSIRSLAEAHNALLVAGLALSGPERDLELIDEKMMRSLEALEAAAAYGP